MESDVRSLITAAEMYPELERLIRAARSRIWLSFRVFDTAMRTPSGEGLAAENETWGALLVAAAARGVDVRILVADFDPIGAPDLHEAAWRSIRALEAELETARISRRDAGFDEPADGGVHPPIQFVAARHPA